MKNLLRGNSILILLLLVLGLSACSNSSSSNNNQSTTTNQNETRTLAAPLSNNDCSRPENVWISNAVFQSKGSYILTYSWNSVPNASAYEFEFLINGTAAFQNPTVTDTSITFPQAVTALDSINVSVRTICGTKKSSSAKESSEIVYLNTISTDDIVFLVEPNTNVTDICSRSCDKLKFNTSSFLNSNDSIITLANFSMQVYYYDFNAVKACIPCNPDGTAPVVDPTAFNNCLRSPLSEHWIYDPGAYQVCP